jgi:hypothetical protein
VTKKVESVFEDEEIRRDFKMRLDRLQGGFVQVGEVRAIEEG